MIPLLSPLESISVFLLLSVIINFWRNVHYFIMYADNRLIFFAVIQDKRCFLENGATAAHLFVSEDLPVGGIVGVLGVVGDPGLQGDIELSLQEHDSPVAFSSYSKNLTLIRPLDKEGIEGPASVYINVICEKKHTLDPVRFLYFY